jgi:hypothetical protein
MSATLKWASLLARAGELNVRLRTDNTVIIQSPATVDLHLNDIAVTGPLKPGPVTVLAFAYQPANIAHLLIIHPHRKRAKGRLRTSGSLSYQALVT